MTQASLIFNLVVVAAFVGQVVNYYLLGTKGIINRYLFLFVLGCYIFTEGVLAMQHPVLWLYVILNFWGVANFLGKQP